MTHVCVCDMILWLVHVWHDSCMCDMTHSCVCDMILWLFHVRHDSCMCMCDMTHVLLNLHSDMTCYAMTHVYICAMTHAYICAMTCAHAQGSSPSFPYKTWHAQGSSCTRAGVVSFISTQDATLCIMTHLHMCHYVCTHAGSPPIPMRDVPCCSITHSYIWHKSCTRAGVVSLIPIQDVICCTMTYSYMYVSLHMHYTQGVSCTIRAIRRGFLLNSHTGRNLLHHDSFMCVITHAHAQGSTTWFPYGTWHVALWLVTHMNDSYEWLMSYIQCAWVTSQKWIESSSCNPSPMQISVGAPARVQESSHTNEQTDFQSDFPYYLRSDFPC